MFSCGVMFRWSLWRLGSRTPVVSCGHCTITTIELKTQPHPLPASYCMRLQLTLEGVCRRYECNQTCSTRKHTQLKTKYSILPPGWILAYIVNKLRITFCNISLMMPGIFFCLCTNQNGFSFPRSAQELGTLQSSYSACVLFIIQQSAVSLTLFA